MTNYASANTQVALVSPIIILGFPLLDTAVTIYFRIKKGIVPFAKSNDHIAFRLLALGLTRKETLFLILGLTLCFSLGGVMMSKVNNGTGILIIFVVTLLSLGLFGVLKRNQG